jgi:hypothetical protein
MRRRIWQAAVLLGFAVVCAGGAGCQSGSPPGSIQGSICTFTSHLANFSIDRTDLLFVIDNSPSMGDQQELLGLAIPDMITRLVQPPCLDANATPTGMNAAPDGTCLPNSKAEFPPLHDLHIGIVTSSLGSRGGDLCPVGATNPANPSLPAHMDDRGELINRGGASETVAPDAQPSHFLSWFPAVAANEGLLPQPTPGIGSVSSLVGDFTEMISGVHEHGCAYTAQNEAWYRFLVQPDPFDRIVVGAHATLEGVDSTILQQRHDFLRPDSLVAVIVVTDGDDRVADPLALAGAGWAFENQAFPGSANGSAPQGTVECSQPVDPSRATLTGPYGPMCTSCSSIQNDPTFASRCPKDGTNGQNGYLDPSDDPLPLRFFQQKRRLGVFAGYPITRYVRGLTKTSVPDRNHEHDGGGNYIGDQDASANCVNPLFADKLPNSTSQELCRLTRGGRTPDLIYYAAIAGVPHQLLQSAPGDPECPMGTARADCAQKDVVTYSTSDWDKIQGGHDPEHYDFTGADFHMIEAPLPRTSGNLPPGVLNASTCDATAADDCDPMSGRERLTNKQDLQFACVFPLSTPKDCSQPQAAGACDCPAAGPLSPLCQKDANGNQTQIQTMGKAYPSVRAMEIAHAMAAQGKGQGIVASLCPIHMTEQMPGDPLYGYRPAVNAILDRLKESLVAQCLPERLAPDSTGSVPCLILTSLYRYAGRGTCKNPGSTCDAAKGLSVPPSDVLARFCDEQQGQYDPHAGGLDPATVPVCELRQLTAKANPQDFMGGSCAGASDRGWCYVTGNSPDQCSQGIIYSANAWPPASMLTLQCAAPTCE